MGKGVYSYKEKYVAGEGMVAAPREIDPMLPGDAADVVRASAATVASVARVRGVARVDFLLVGDRVWVNEVNTIPGSLAKHLWAAPSVPFIELLDAMLEEALRRPPFAWTVDGADGTALRSAGTIASKLG